MESFLSVQFENILRNLQSEMTPERISEILSKKRSDRIQKEHLILYGVAMKFKILKQLSKIIQKGRFINFVGRFKIHKLKAGEIIYHVGDHN